MPPSAIRTVVLGLTGALSLSACAHPPPPEAPPKAPYCPTVQAEAEPLLVLADQPRAALQANRFEHAVAVRYETQGCEVTLEVLQDCVASALPYEYRPFLKREARIATNEAEVFSQLPLGATYAAPRLDGESVRADTFTVGQLNLSTKHELQRKNFEGPSCARATHYVTHIHVGGFSLVAGNAETLANTIWFDPAAHAAAHPGAQLIRMEGTPAQCGEAVSTSERLALCSVPLRLGLAPLDPAPVPPGAALDVPRQREYARIDARLRAEFDRETGHQQLRGSVTQVILTFRAYAADAKDWYKALQQLLEGQPGAKWEVNVKLRQASLYEGLATSLREVKAPALQMFTPHQLNVLAQADASDNPDLQEKAAAIRAKIDNAWKTAREKELRATYHIAIVKYAELLLSAKELTGPLPEARFAIERLAQLTTWVGEESMREHMANYTPQIAYEEGLFQRLRDSGAT
ncbi:MAG: hypothetical protein KC492_34300, partial [Myxococcales bacterium]|nr:hypothetical protein [Myxococcales bacterium]